MTSLERRHEARYQRRKAKRAAKAGEYDKAISYDALYKANLVSRRNVSWKASVQKYQKNLLRNLYKAHENLKAGNDISRGFVEFDLSERGKTRHIRSIHYSERVVQRSLCDNILVPAMSRNLIYDNGACLQGKGVQWSIERLEAHLHKFYRRYRSNNGYILCFDFRKYFDSIDHEICFDMYNKYFDDPRIIRLLHYCVYPFGFPFSQEKWTRTISTDSSLNTGKSLGLGSQVSQITAVTYPNTLDHFIYQQLKPEFYIRYMDDGCIIFKTKEQAQQALKEIITYCTNKLKLEISAKKTHIQKLSQPFKFLKVSFKLNDSGSITKVINKQSITRERRRLKKLTKKLQNGEIDLESIVQSYGSWKGYAMYRNGEAPVRQIDKLYKALFNLNPPNVVLKNKNKWRHKHGRNGFNS